MVYCRYEGLLERRADLVAAVLGLSEVYSYGDDMHSSRQYLRLQKIALVILLT